LRQDCFFYFFYVTDIADVLIHFIEHNNMYSDYNMCSGERIRILTIAEEVCRQLGVNATITCQKDGFNNEYTGSNARLLAEMPEWKPKLMKDSVTNILLSERVL
jgi:GDP-L-fucose synthase